VSNMGIVPYDFGRQEKGRNKKYSMNTFGRRERKEHLS
jgi:hypothetical protein